MNIRSKHWHSQSHIALVVVTIKKIDDTSDENDRAIIEAITDMAQHLGIEVIAEGVESASQREILERIGCQWLQGYFFSPPVTAGEFATFMRDEYLKHTQAAQSDN